MTFFSANWPKIDSKLFKFCLLFCLKKMAKNWHFFGPFIQKWPKIDPESFKIRKRSDSTLGLAHLAHSMAQTAEIVLEFCKRQIHMKLNSKGLIKFRIAKFHFSFQLFIGWAFILNSHFAWNLGNFWNFLRNWSNLGGKNWKCGQFCLKKLQSWSIFEHSF